MKTRVTVLLTYFAISVLAGRAADYSGNGKTGFGGPIGLGSLSLSDDGTTISGTVTKGPNPFYDILVIYVDSVSGGFGSTAGFFDANDELRAGISGFDGGANRSTLTFASGFNPDYAIALKPTSPSNFGGLWQLANGGPISLNFISTVNLNPTANNLSSTYNFSLNVTQVGLAPNSGATFGVFGTFVSGTGYRSDEAVAGDDTGTQGWNPFLQTAFSTYTIVPEPSVMVLLVVGGLALCIRRRK